MGGSVAYLRIIFYLLCFVAVLVLAAKATRWLGGRVGRGRGRYLQVIDTLYLGPNCFLSLIMVCRRLYLIGTVERNINLLREIDDPKMLALILAENTPAEDGVGKAQKGKSFPDYLQRLLGTLPDGGGNFSAPPGAESSAERIEERLMKLRTHRGPSEDE
ncbi:MAG: flagellar biosynthetic protein FliO [Firmicutes bacterium]|nr:flagellar biosynthetic protein FliO [Bacillota bacterium]